MITPIVNAVSAFDATESHAITFSVSGGDQVARNTIRITDSNTGTVVYTNTVNTFQFSQTIEANTLVNGTYYNVSFRTYDIDGNASAWSNYQPFYCYTTPTLSFNVQEGEVLDSTNATIELTYDQEEGELLNYAIINLYDINGVLVDSSGDLYDSDQPPLTLSHTFNGLDNNSYYFVSATVYTVEQTLVETPRTRFRISYNSPEVTTALEVEADNCNGAININTAFKGIPGTSNPSDPVYIDDRMVDLVSCDADFNHTETARWVQWDSEFTVPTDFLFRLWFYPSMIENKVFEIGSMEDDSVFVKGTYVRGTTKDYVEISTNNGTTISSNEIDHCNGNSYCFLWVKVVGSTWEVVLEKLDEENTVFNWNDDTNNVQYNMTTDLTYVGESYESYTTVNTGVALESEFNKVIVGNGIFDQIDITKDTSLSYTTAPPVFDYYTILDCTFNGNINGGNSDIVASQVTSIALKRKDLYSDGWVTIYQKRVSGAEDINFTYTDRTVPSYVTQTYAVVPTIDGAEGDYITQTVTPHWQGTYITDGVTSFKLYNAVLYNSSNQNISVGTVSPLGAKYPIVIQNSANNFMNGGLQAQLLGYDFEQSKQINRQSVVKQRNDFLAFLTNGSAKMIVDWNGDCLMVRVANAPTMTFVNSYGNGIVNVGFTWVEQGNYNNEEDLIKNGFAKQLN